MVVLDALFPEASTPTVFTVCISTDDATELADNTCAFRAILLQNNHVLPPEKNVEASMDLGDATHRVTDVDSLDSMEVKCEGVIFVIPFPFPRWMYLLVTALSQCHHP
jgi:hypothetical protein